MSAEAARLGYGLYFIDVLACLLFAVTLALVGARFGHEQSVSVELPPGVAPGRTGAGLAAPAITLRSLDGEVAIFLEDEALTLAELEDRLRRAPPPSVVVRSEASTLARVIAMAHAVGVADIQLAYEVRPAGEVSP